MATIKPRRPCAHAGCREWATHGSYCAKHYAEYLEKREAQKKQYFVAWQEKKRRSNYKRPQEQLLYRDPKWQKASKIFLSANPICVICGKPATDTDHIIPHKGDYKLFWDASNWQPLCHECHARKTYEENREAYRERERERKEERLKKQHDGMNIYYIK